LNVNRPDPEDWPVSFSFYDPSDRDDRTFVARLRVYPLNKTDPDPALTIDRLVRIHLQPGVRGSVRVVLRGSCFGMPADLDGLRTCVDTEGRYDPVETAALDPDMKIPATSVQGTLAQQPCALDVRPPSTSLFDEEVCVSAGAFVFGNLNQFGEQVGAASASLFANGTPERVALITPFRMDRFEVTVGRWKDALAHGFVPSETPTINEQPIPTSDTQDPTHDTRYCTFRNAPDRDSYPINCVSWDAASEFCKFEGGSLPTEAQWEWVAQALGRAHKTDYPWGNDQPTCDMAIFARQNVPYDTCHIAPVNLEYGPRPEDDPHGDKGALGVVNLAGSMAEWIADGFQDFRDACWTGASLTNPRCDHFDMDGRVSVRGGGWWGPWENLLSGWRQGTLRRGLTQVGFRCVRGAP
jgi:formylglycine-generating enzyme required for sulfatase activity